MTVRVPCLCPVCGLGVVVAYEKAWTSAGRDRRSVWADLPLRCGAGCELTDDQAGRLLTGLYERRGRQLPLLEAAA
jgi:hypothetical protein